MPFEDDVSSFFWALTKSVQTSLILDEFHWSHDTQRSFDFPEESPKILETNNPAFAMQASYEENASPSAAAIPAVEQYMSSYTVIVPTNINSEYSFNAIALIISDEETTRFRVNTLQVTAPSDRKLLSSKHGWKLYGFRLAVDVGILEVSSVNNHGFGLIVLSRGENEKCTVMLSSYCLRNLNQTEHLLDVDLSFLRPEGSNPVEGDDDDVTESTEALETTTTTATTTTSTTTPMPNETVANTTNSTTTTTSTTTEPTTTTTTINGTDIKGNGTGDVEASTASDDAAVASIAIVGILALIAIALCAKMAHSRRQQAAALAASRGQGASTELDQSSSQQSQTAQ